MEIETSSYNMTVTMTVEEFTRFSAHDFSKAEAKLLALGASEIDYDDHFGPHVFFTVEKEEQGRKVMEALRKLAKEKP
jgi:hypothetical protein